MSEHEPEPPRPPVRLLPADDRRGRRHLQLVTDSWITELAELVELHPQDASSRQPRSAHNPPRAGLPQRLANASDDP